MVKKRSRKNPGEQLRRNAKQTEITNSSDSITILSRNPVGKK